MDTSFNQLNSDCYQEGRDAFSRSQSDDTCPYQPENGASNERWSWMKGYYDYKYELFWDKWMLKQTLGDLARIKQILSK